MFSIGVLFNFQHARNSFVLINIQSEAGYKESSWRHCKRFPFVSSGSLISFQVGIGSWLHLFGVIFAKNWYRLEITTRQVKDKASSFWEQEIRINSDEMELFEVGKLVSRLGAELSLVGSVKGFLLLSRVLNQLSS